MSDTTQPPDPEPSSPEEHELQRVAELQGDPYLLYRNSAGRLQVVSLPGSWEQVNIGRSMSTEISLGWDPQVSTVHAKLERLGDDWVLVDDGLSRNGSFVNEEKVVGRRRLNNGDRLRFGRTAVIFYAPLELRQRTHIA